MELLVPEVEIKKQLHNTIVGDVTPHSGRRLVPAFLGLAKCRNNFGLVKTDQGCGV
ncbi:MAG: hypothetical protein HQ511_00965 [Rhodospirillales bacterium]|nr:hypothetical protein [Rhodospirillales bacterium]